MPRSKTPKGKINPDTNRLQFTEGKTTGLGITQVWVKVFAENETKRWTDERIAKFMLSEFPRNDSQILAALAVGEYRHVQTVRARYNRGMLTNRKSPDVQSHRYDAEGSQDDPVLSGKKGVKVADVVKQRKASAAK